jgi:hypothetical protein
MTTKVDSEPAPCRRGTSRAPAPSRPEERARLLLAEERLRQALRAGADRFEPSINAYARLAERVSTKRVPPRRWTEPRIAGFPATATIALVAVAGGLALVAERGEGDFIAPISPAPGHAANGRGRWVGPVSAN